jgi:large subunit ribosomal protein L5
MARLRERYQEEVVPALKERFEYKNVMQVPRLEKIVVNMGVGEAAQNSRALDGAMNDLARITGQKPQLRRARKSIAGFKIREGMPVGARVTLRGERMWEFLDRLISIALRHNRRHAGLRHRGGDDGKNRRGSPGALAALRDAVPGELGGAYDEESFMGQAAEAEEVRCEGVQQVPAVRPGARVLPEVRFV